MEDEKGPGLDFSLGFVCGSRPWGAEKCRFYFVFVYFILLKSLMFAGSRLLFPDLRTSLHWCRNPGGRRDTLSESPRCWGDRGAEEIGQQEVAETASGCPMRPPAKEDQVGQRARCRALGSRRGGCPPRGSGGVGAEACCHPPCLGRMREWGTRCRLPSTGGAITVSQEAEERSLSFVH